MEDAEVARCVAGGADLLLQQRKVVGRTAVECGIVAQLDVACNRTRSKLDENPVQLGLRPQPL